MRTWGYLVDLTPASPSLSSDASGTSPLSLSLQSACTACDCYLRPLLEVKAKRLSVCMEACTGCSPLHEVVSSGPEAANVRNRQSSVSPGRLPMKRRSPHGTIFTFSLAYLRLRPASAASTWPRRETGRHQTAAPTLKESYCERTTNAQF